jgi:alkyldihydroxyacetonephosphate synthase
MRWWGWGEDVDRPPALSERVLAHLRERVGAAPRPRPPVPIAQVTLPPSALASTSAQAMREIVGPDAVRDDHADRVRHAAGKGYADLVSLRAGTPSHAPDAVVYPSHHAHVRGLLEVCAERSVAVVPFGGGTSVVGGLAPLRGGHRAVVALDLRRLSGPGDIDRESHTVTCGAGLRVRTLERLLAARGLTLGHFPQSYEYVSVGGCAATRSAGQASTGYGRFDEMVLGLRCACPAGDIELPARPASAAGPELRRLVVGSEGALGAITEVALRVRVAPSEKVYEGVFFETFAGGLQALRMLAQQGATPDVGRLSDEPETAMSLTLAGSRRLGDGLGRAYLRMRGYRHGALAILGFEGEPELVAARRRRALDLARRQGGLPVGRSPGDAWAASRFSAPYLRDELLGHGVMVETLETATTWSSLDNLYLMVRGAIAGALSGRGTPGLVLCHISHLYETGASLYFTFLARQQEGRELDQWRAVKDAASQAIVSHGGTITHHHAVGRDHAPWMREEVGAQGVKALRALKADLDPEGIMNPGKLLVERREGL